MKILKESKKENLPIAFLTSFISHGWDEIGNLKEEMSAIKKEFAGTKKIEELIQELIDAYLICVGQMELHLENKDYLEFPDLSETEAINEELESEAVAKIIDAEKTVIDSCKAAETGDKEVEDLILLNELENTALNNINTLNHASQIDSPSVQADEAEATIIPSEYFVDFDEPDFTAVRVTDADLYPDQVETK